MNNVSSGSLRPVGVYLLLTLALSSIFYFLIISKGSLSGGRGTFVTGLMWCPGMGAILTSLILKRKVSLLGWQWGKTKYQLWSYLVPLMYSLIAYLIIWSAGFGKFYNTEFVENLESIFGFRKLPDLLSVLVCFMLIGLFALPVSCTTALGEEIGWRGFLAPELYKRFGYTKASFFTGIVWSLWHYPILIFADYNSGTPTWYAFGCFTVMVISISFVFTWFRIESGSLWTAMLLHGSHNLFVQAFFTPITADTGNTKYYVDEFGAVLPLVTVLVAIYFFRRRKELNSTKVASELAPAP